MGTTNLSFHRRSRQRISGCQNGCNPQGRFTIWTRTWSKMAPSAITTGPSFPGLKMQVKVGENVNRNCEYLGFFFSFFYKSKKKSPDFTSHSSEGSVFASGPVNLCICHGGKMSATAAPTRQGCRRLSTGSQRQTPNSQIALESPTKCQCYCGKKEASLNASVAVPLLLRWVLLFLIPLLLRRVLLFLRRILLCLKLVHGDLLCLSLSHGV